MIVTSSSRKADLQTRSPIDGPSATCKLLYVDIHSDVRKKAGVLSPVTRKHLT